VATILAVVSQAPTIKLQGQVLWNCYTVSTLRSLASELLGCRQTFAKTIKDVRPSTATHSVIEQKS
jgi:hypothetical protein